MSGRAKGIALPPELYGRVVRGAAFLQRAGDPRELERAAERLESCATVEPFAADGGILSPAVSTLRSVARIGHQHLSSLRAMRFDFDFASGKLVLPPRSRRGTRGDLMRLLIAGAFDELAPTEWYAAATFDAVRDKLRSVLSDEECAALTDGKIKGVIERHA